MKKLRVGVVGGRGYTGGECIRLLLHHPDVKLISVTSRGSHGQLLTECHPDLIGQTKLCFTERLHKELDVVFLCLPHGQSNQILATLNLSRDTKIIDMSHDHRLKTNREDFLYGLPELNREAIRVARKIANPGCFATAIELALLPIASAKGLPQDIHVSAITGSTGAGVQPSSTSHFSWRHNNISIYKAFHHQHLEEIYESLCFCQMTWKPSLHLVPFRGGFTRGIYVSIVLKTSLSEDNMRECYKSFYKSHPFVHFVDGMIDLKPVVNTNSCLLTLNKHHQMLHIVSCLDNLLKGASGQAVQNMNLMCGLQETAGLFLKPSVY